MKPGRFDFPPILHGDTFQAWHFQFVDKDDEPIDLSGAEVDLSIAKHIGGKSVAGIDGSIVNASQGEYQTQPFKMEMNPGMYTYDLTIYFPNDQTYTYLQGLLRVLPNVKRFEQ